MQETTVAEKNCQLLEHCNLCNKCRSAVCHRISVCPSVCLLHADTVTKRIKLRSCGLQLSDNTIILVLGKVILYL